MKIVILDGYTLNPGDLKWDQLQNFGELAVYDRTDEEDIAKRCEGAEAVFTNKTRLSSETIKSLSGLKYIGVLATGYDVVDIITAKQHGIVVTNVPDYSSDSVAQTVFAMILAVTNKIKEHSSGIKKWSSSKDFCYSDFKLIELSGKTLGIVGFGNIGRKVSKIGEAFGMKIIVHTRTKPENTSDRIEVVSFDDLLKKSDFVTLHCPLTEKSENLINSKTIKMMKSNAVLINTARGALIDEDALCRAVSERRIYGAALDVLRVEPPSVDNPLLSQDGIYITPHNAWATFESRKRLMERVVGNFDAFLKGKPVNVVNG